MNKNTKKVKQLIRDNLYMTISVSDLKGNPWIANIYYAYEKDYNFYWYSPKNSKHSEIINKNPNIAISIFDSTAVGDDVDAVYIKAKAYEVTEKKELVKGLLAYGKKMLDTKFVNSKSAFEKFIKSYRDFSGDSPLRMYKAIPEKFWKLADSEVYKDKYVDSRVEVDLS